MICYFSGTGNSKWVAEQLAIKTNDNAINLIREPAPFSISGEIFGIVFPVYAWGVPEPVVDFVKNSSDSQPSVTRYVHVVVKQAMP